MDGSGKERVRVAVRIRPFLETDPEEAQLTAIKLDETHLAVGEKRVFRVDRVFGMDDDTDTIYRQSVAPLVSSFLEGCSTTVMAYGQTGSGKTFTVNGLIPEVLHRVVQDGGGGSADGFSFQCLEVYGDTVRDLFSPHPEASGSAVRLYEGPAEDLVIAADRTVQLVPKERRTDHRYAFDRHSGDRGFARAFVRGVQVIGARRLKARSLEDVLHLVDAGTAVRATAATHMNAHSSRSHCIFTVFDDHRGCKLHLVDLAGSERNKKTLNVGQRFEESVAINTGLFALGNVIRALARQSQTPSSLSAGDTAEAASTHIPYRSGKLTRLLQDALGGHSKTLFIACVAPDSTNREETLRTAQYCSLAMKVLNVPVREFERLQRQQHQRPQSGSRSHHSRETSEAAERLRAVEEERDQLLQETELLRDELQCTYEYVETCEEELSRDVTTFNDQIRLVERLLGENRALAQRVSTLEMRPQPRQGALTESRSPASASPGPAPATTLNPSPLDDELAEIAKAVNTGTSAVIQIPKFRGGHLRSESPDWVANAAAAPDPVPDVQRWSSPSPQAASVYDSLKASLAQPMRASSATWTGGVVRHEANASTSELVELQRHRDEQMMQLAREALAYQRQNSELRGKLSAMVTLLETHQRESALLRLELEACKGKLSAQTGSST